MFGLVMKNLMLVALVIITSSCATQSNNHKMLFHSDLYEPSPSTSYVGVIYGEPFADGDEVMRNLCAKWGGLNTGSIKRTVNWIGEQEWKFQCYPPAATTTYSDDNSKGSDKNLSNWYKGGNNQENYTGGGYAPTESDKAVTSQPASTKNTLDLSAAKLQCVELGFKSGTEKFGKCVMELSK